MTSCLYEIDVVNQLPIVSEPRYLVPLPFCKADLVQTAWIGSSVAFCKRCAKAGYEISNSILSNVGILFLAIIGTLIFPCVPLMVELQRKGSIDPENIVLIAAVLATGFAITADHTLTRSAHALLFIAGIIVGAPSSPSSPFTPERWAITLLVAVCGVHAMERFVWHVVLSRPFPDTKR